MGDGFFTETPMKPGTMGYWIFTGLLAVLVGFVGFGIGGYNCPINRMLRKAQELAAKPDVESKKNSIEALNEAREFIDLAMENLKIEESRQMFALALGEMLMKSDMWLEAIKYLDIAYSILPGDYSINYDIAFCYMRMYQFAADTQKKEEYYQKTLHHGTVAFGLLPDNPNINYLMGILKFDKGDLKGAMKNFSVILAKYPDDVDTLLAAARIYFETGDYTKAQKIYIKLESILPEGHPKLKLVEQNMQNLSGSMANE